MRCHIYRSYILLCTPFLRVVPPCGPDSGPWTAFWACLTGLLGLPGPQSCLPGPQYCLSWPSGRHLDVIWTPSGRQLDAKRAPVGLPKRLPVSTYVFRTPRQLPSPTERLANGTSVAGWRQYATLVHIYIYIYIEREREREIYIYI